MIRGEESFHIENTEITDFGGKMLMILYIQIKTHIYVDTHSFILKSSVIEKVICYVMYLDLDLQNRIRI